MRAMPSGALGDQCSRSSFGVGSALVDRRRPVRRRRRRPRRATAAGPASSHSSQPWQQSRWAPSAARRSWSWAARAGLGPNSSATSWQKETKSSPPAGACTPAAAAVTSARVLAAAAVRAGGCVLRRGARPDRRRAALPPPPLPALLRLAQAAGAGQGAAGPGQRAGGRAPCKCCKPVVLQRWRSAAGSTC